MQNSCNSLQELATEVTRLENIKRDYILPSSAGFVEPNGTHMNLTSHGHINGGSFHGRMTDQFTTLLISGLECPATTIS